MFRLESLCFSFVSAIFMQIKLVLRIPQKNVCNCIIFIAIGTDSFFSISKKYGGDFFSLSFQTQLPCILIAGTLWQSLETGFWN